jgi:hypothetical protein
MSLHKVHRGRNPTGQITHAEWALAVLLVLSPFVAAAMIFPVIREARRWG